MKDAQDLKPGFSCQAEIITETIPSALYLPVQAVFRDGKRYVVYPAGARSAEPVEVTPGRATTKYVELRSGVRAGMKVLLNPPEKAAPAPKPQAG